MARGEGSPSDATRPGSAATYRLILEYDGSRYRGWQEQKNARTVQGEVRRALEEASFPLLDLGGAGRTDAGVHALAQCAHVRLGQRVHPAELLRALNRRLPRDVHVLDVQAAKARFHARHDAVARSYLYQISRRRTAFAKPWVWWVREPLHLERMRAGLELLPGRHDFRHFCELREETGTLVEIVAAELAEAGALVLIRLVASHFLWRMVRRVVGTLVRLGTGELEVGAFAELLAARDLPPGSPGPAQWTAPGAGLFLERVLYPGDPSLGPPVAVNPVTSAR